MTFLFFVDKIVNGRRTIMPKSKEEFERIKEKRRYDIIKTATYIFAFNNYKSVTTDSITNELKCSHGLFYHYFKNKEELFSEVVTSAIATAKELVDFNLLNVDNAKDALENAIRCVLLTTKDKDDYHSCCLYLLLNLRLQINNVNENEETRKKCVLALNKLRQMIERGQKEGSIKDYDAEELTICLIALMEGLLYNRLMVGVNNFKCPSVELIMRIVETN